MAHTFENFKEASIDRPVALPTRQSHDPTYRISGPCIADQLLEASAALPPKEFLGFQVSFSQPMPETFTAFSGAGVRVTDADYGWLFCREGEAKAGEAEALFGPDRRVYALAGAPKDPDDAAPGEERTHDPETFQALREACGLVRVLTAGEEGLLLLSLPQPLDLHLRTKLSVSFPFTRVEELRREEDLARVRPIPGTLLRRHLRLLLWGMEKLCEEEDREDPEEIEIEAVFQEDVYEEDVAEPLEALDLSVRAFNILRRAGVDTLEKFDALTEQEVRSLPHLGLRCTEEVLKKLRERRGESEPREDSLKALDTLVGLEPVKDQVRQLAAFARMKQDMKVRGLNTAALAMNMEFVGNPGTAKTTVARILAGVFHQVGLLPCSEPLEVGRADLVARYEGQTADKVRQVFLEARGRLLFIDEAYSLLEDRRGTFGDEAIATIVQEMENHRADTVVVFAGYPKEMEEFISRNPGLRSRVPFRISFSDYAPEELAAIARLEAERRGFTLDPAAEETLEGLCAQAAYRPELGNGRFCRNLVEQAVLSYAARTYGDETPPESPDFVLRREDLFFPQTLQARKQPTPLGFRA